MRPILTTTITAFTVLGVFFLSLAIFPLYVNGDQLHYRQVYEQISSLTLIDAFAYYKSSLDSREPIHFLIIYIFSPYLDKDLLMSLSNAALAYAALRLCRKLGTSPIIAALTLLTNYYFFVMYFSAERLKFAMFFLMLGLSLSNKNRLFYSFPLLAILTHAQTTLIYVSTVLKSLFRSTIYLFNTSKAPLFLLTLPIIVTLAAAVSLDQLAAKFSSYYQSDRSLFEITKNAFFLILTLCVARNKADVIVLFTPILAATMLVGGDRVNMIGYLTFLYFSIQYRGGLNIFNASTALYFFVKAIFFVDNIVRHGTGFPTG